VTSNNLFEEKVI